MQRRRANASRNTDFVSTVSAIALNRREPDLDVLGPIGHQTPPHQIEGARFRLRIEADDGQIVGRCDIPTRREIRRRILRRYSERDPYLADIGLEFGPSAHAATLALTAMRRQAYLRTYRERQISTPRNS